MTKKTGVLFDLDGVLIDTETTYYKFWDAINEEFPTPYPDLARRIKGTTLGNIFATYYPDVELQKEIETRLMKFQDEMPYTIFDGAMEFVEQLNAAGIPCCIVTSSDDHKMEKLFAVHPDFKRHFNFIITGNMVQNSKPHPECFLKGAEAIGCDIADCFVFEDSLQGLAAGNAAGATVIGIATTYTRDEIKDKAHKVLDGFVGFTVDDMMAVK